MYLRNVHPKQTVYLPICAGWCRVLKPAVTTSVPTALLHTFTVRRLLLRRLVEVVDGAAWDADIRQRRAAKADIARAVARAEQAEFDKLLQPLQIKPRRVRMGRPYKHRADMWSPARTERLKARWAEGATGPKIAAEFGVSPGAVSAKARREGLNPRYQQRGDHWSEVVTR